MRIFFLQLIFFELISIGVNAQDADTLKPFFPRDSLTDRLLIQYKVKLYLNDGSELHGFANYLKDGKIFFDSTKEIPVAKIKKIRLYRNIYGKLLTAFSGVGFFIGFIYSEITHTGDIIAVIDGVLVAIPCAGAGAILCLPVLPFYKYRFPIDGNEEKIKSMMKRVKPGEINKTKPASR